MWRDNVIYKVKKNGYKLTPQRIKLIDILDEAGSRHPSLMDILEIIKRDFPTISFSTLYSNILLLKKLGILDLFYVEGAAHVELNTDPHLNIITEDGIIDFVNIELIRHIEEKINRKVKFVNVILR